MRLCAHPAPRLFTVPATSLSNERLISYANTSSWGHLPLTAKPIKLPMYFCLSTQGSKVWRLSLQVISLGIMSLLKKSNDSLAEAGKLFLLMTLSDRYINEMAI